MHAIGIFINLKPVIMIVSRNVRMLVKLMNVSVSSTD